MIGLPNPWVLLGGLVAAIGVFFYGMHIGTVKQIAKQTSDDALIAKVAATAQLAAATEIGKIQIHNTTIKAQTETLTREIPVYRDCRNTPDVMRLLNDALGAAPGPLAPGSGELPATVPAH